MYAYESIWKPGHDITWHSMPWLVMPSYFMAWHDIECRVMPCQNICRAMTYLDMAWHDMVLHALDHRSIRDMLFHQG